LNEAVPHDRLIYFDVEGKNEKCRQQRRPPFRGDRQYEGDEIARVPDYLGFQLVRPMPEPLREPIEAEIDVQVAPGTVPIWRRRAAASPRDR
jgi:hypothetical protein